MSDFPEFHPGHSLMEWAELARRAGECGIDYSLTASNSPTSGRALIGFGLRSSNGQADGYDLFYTACAFEHEATYKYLEASRIIAERELERYENMSKADMAELVWGAKA